MKVLTVLIAGTAVGALALSGCVAEVPAPVTSAPPMAEGAALLEEQSQSVIEQTMDELAAADAAGDAELLTNRVGGDFKTLRAIEYMLAAEEDGPAVTAIPRTRQAVYVSGANAWPRTLVAVTEQAGEDTTPVVLVWVQDSVDADYQLRHWAHMVPGATIPAMPSTLTGAQQFDVTTDAVDPVPAQALTDYATLLEEGPESDLNEAFGEDSYREQLFTARETLTEAAEDAEGEYSVSAEFDLDSAYAMGTGDGGALVFAPLRSSSTLTVQDAKVSVPEENKPLLEGDLEDTVTLTYLDFIVMYIPGPEEDGLPTVVATEHTLIEVSDS